MAIPALTAPNAVTPGDGCDVGFIGVAQLLDHDRDRIFVTEVHRTEPAIHGPAAA